MESSTLVHQSFPSPTPHPGVLAKPFLCVRADLNSNAELLKASNQMLEPQCCPQGAEPHLLEQILSEILSPSSEEVSLLTEEIQLWIPHRRPFCKVFKKIIFLSTL